MIHEDGWPVADVVLQNLPSPDLTLAEEPQVRSWWINLRAGIH